MQNIFIEFLPPWVETGLQPAFYDKESGTVLQQTARMYAKINELIKNNNDLIAKFTELYQYVHDYFDNLDVQEEIDNKLDEMAESGELVTIIAEYIKLGALITYETLADAISSENLAVNSKVKTLGKYSAEDGLGAYYIVGETGDIALDNGLYLTQVENFGGNNYYNEVTTTKYRANNSDYYVTTIPYLDANDEEINIYVGQAKDGSQTPNDYARENHTTLTCNATINTGTAGFGVGSVISNGEIIRDIDPTLQSRNYLQYIGIKDGRVFSRYQANQTTAQEMIDDGCEQAWLAYYSLITNGVKDDLTQLVDPGLSIATGLHPRQCIGVKADKTVVMLTVDGRDDRNRGMTSAECADILYNLGCINAWNLDGGGSTSTSLKGYKINRDVDNDGTTDRWIEFTINVKRLIIDEELANAYSELGLDKNRLSASLMEIINATKPQMLDYRSAGDDLDDLTGKIITAYVQNVQNAPEQSGYFVNIPHSQSEYADTYCTQLFFTRDTNKTYQRRCINGDFTKWVLISGGASNILGANYTLTTSNAYEIIPMSTEYTVGDLNSNIDYVEPADNTCEKFKVVLNGTRNVAHTVRITARCNITSNATAGTRYLTVGRGSSDNLRGSAKVTIPANSSAYVASDNIYDDVTNSNEFYIAVYGKEGDVVERPSITVQVLD